MFRFIMNKKQSYAIVIRLNYGQMHMHFYHTEHLMDIDFNDDKEFQILHLASVSFEAVVEELLSLSDATSGVAEEVGSLRK